MSAAVSFYGSRYQHENKNDRRQIENVGEWVERVTLNELASYEVPSYQAPVQPYRVRMIARDFNLKKFGLCEVAVLPDGSRLLNDGQHRTGGGIAAGEGESLVYIKCTRVRSVEEAASLYLGINNRKMKPAGALVMARAEIGDTAAAEMIRIAERHGFKIQLVHRKHEESNNAFKCPETLIKILDKRGPEHFSDVMDVMRRSWDGHHESLKSNIVNAVSQFVLAYPEIAAVEIGKRLSAITPQLLDSYMKTAQLSESTIGGRRKGFWYGRGVLEAWNRNRRVNRLEDRFDEFGAVDSMRGKWTRPERGS